MRSLCNAALTALFVVFLVLLVSCVDDAIWWDLPPDMTDEERAAFGEACERWNHVAIRQQYINEPGGGGTHRVQLRLREDMINNADIDGDGISDVNGEYDNSSHTMHLRRGQSGPSLVMVDAHEQGHALGLQHHAGPGVMNKNAGQVGFSTEDIEECRRVNACR